MKKRFGTVLLGFLAIILVACTNNGEENNLEEKNTLKIGTSAITTEATKAMEDSLKEMGYDLEVVPFDDITQPNVALEEGTIDANLFQHKDFMDQVNDSEETNFVFSEPLFAGYVGLFSKKYADLKELPENAEVGIFSDPSNIHRSLILAEQNDLIALEELSDGHLYHLEDISENPNNLQFITLQSNPLVQSVNDLDASFVTAEMMLLGDEDPSAYLIREDAEVVEEFGIGIVTRDEDADTDWINDLNAAFRTEETQNKIDEYYQGAFLFF